MSWSPEALARAPIEELVRYASAETATLRQMHALRELAVRASASPELLGQAAELVVAHLGNRWRVGGLPVGYLGASVLYAGPGRTALLAAAALADPVEREDLLRWLSPPPRAAVDPRGGPIERELLVHEARSDEQLARAMSDLVEEGVAVTGMAVPGPPGLVALVAASAAGWLRLEQERARLSSALDTTVYWPGPGELGPDVWVAVEPGGRARLVEVAPEGLGYALR